MPDVAVLQRNLAHHWGRAAMAQRMGDETARAEAIEAAEAVCRLLDQLERASDWDTLKGSPDHG